MFRLKINKIGLLCFIIVSSAMGQTKLMTYNIRYNNPKDGDNAWNHRKSEIIEMIRYYRPDILGIQEGLHDQVLYLNDNLPNYDYVGVGRDDGKTKGEYAAIFYDSGKFEILDVKSFWLSETPDRVSVGWDASMERIVTFAKLKSKISQQLIYVFNVHYDHRGEEARRKSSELILKLIDDMKLNESQIVVMGDFNSQPHQLPITILVDKLEDSFASSKNAPYGPIGTFNGFDLAKVMDERIDYIFTLNLNVNMYRAIDDHRKNNLYLSDHLPILIEIIFE